MLPFDPLQLTTLTFDCYGTLARGLFHAERNSKSPDGIDNFRAMA